MGPNPLELESVGDLQRKVMNQKFVLDAMSSKCLEYEHDLSSLKTVVSEKNAKLTRLEAENIRLKMQRTDAELQIQVDGLRKEVATKDRRLVEVERAVTTMRDSEALALRRAVEAEQKVKLLQATLETMQTARDTAQRETELSDQAFRGAVSRADAADKRSFEAAEAGKAAVKPWERLVELAYKIVQRSPSLNRNESEVKAFQKAREALVAPRTAVAPG